jgi:photosystem II stability/assembly factor-like uncharacterized protein
VNPKVQFSTMKNLPLLFYFLFSAVNFTQAQSGWNYLPNAPIVVNRFDDIYFVNDSTGWAVNGDGQIYRTANAGDSWALQLTAGYYFRSVEFISDSIGFAGTLTGEVLKTEDAGQTWNNIEQTFPHTVPGVCGIGHLGDTILMQGIWSSPAYILRSIDAGITWSYTDMSSFASGLVDCWFQSADTVFLSGIGTSSTGSHGVIFRSIDAGQTWTLVGTSSTPSTYAWKLQFTSSLIGYASLSENTGNQSHVMKTIDGGATWTTLFVVNTNIDGEGIGFVNDSVGWTGGWSSGMYETIDGGQTWTFLNFGMNLNRFIFLHNNLAYAAGKSIYKFTGLTTDISILQPERKDIHSFNIFPDPVCEEGTIQIHLGKSTRIIFEVYDSEGRMIKSFVNGKAPEGVYTFSINRKEFIPGIYYAVLRTNEHFLTKRFLMVE